jgi:invasion protein IalB
MTLPRRLASGGAADDSGGMAALMNGTARTIAQIFSGFAFWAFAVLTTMPAEAQGAIKDKHGDWETRCETPPGAAYEQCAIVLSVVDQERPNVTLVVVVLNTSDRKARLMRVIAPLGVLLPAGVSLRVDNDDFGRLSFLQCLANGCIAQLAIEDKLLDKLKTGKTATLGIFQTPEQGVGVLAPLAGFKEAYEQLP